MATCGYCGSTILMGGVRDGDRRFCNNRCHQNAYLLSISQQVPPDVLDRALEEVFRGNCPKCRGLGPVDVHKIHRVWSALVLTSWNSVPEVCCRSCGIKGQIGGLLFSFFLGWWGFPWGIILTPVQISRNLIGMCRGPDSSQPSADLQRLVQVSIAAQLIQASRHKPA